MSNVRLPKGPIFGARFVPWSWMAMQGKDGKNIFETLTYNQVVEVMVDKAPTQRNIDYAELIQDGNWD